MGRGDWWAQSLGSQESDRTEHTLGTDVRGQPSYAGLVKKQGRTDETWEKARQPTPVLLPGESQGRGAWWAACRPWGR